MRLWTIHPRYLDKIGLVALWREALLAQKVLLNKTKGYRFHPQLNRFKETNNPLAYIGAYLYQIWLESQKRNYKFQKHKIKIIPNKDHPSLLNPLPKIKVNSGQVKYEFYHLQKKLEKRDYSTFLILKKFNNVHLNPIFKRTRSNKIADWEKLSSL